MYLSWHALLIGQLQKVNGKLKVIHRHIVRE